MEELLQIYIATIKEITLLFDSMDGAKNQIEFDSLHDAAHYLQQAVIPIRLACVRLSQNCSPEDARKYTDVIVRGNW